jgi:hypothetical protein
VCGTPANHAIAIAHVFADVHSDQVFGPVVIFLCDWHFYNPGNAWEARHHREPPTYPGKQS